MKFIRRAIPLLRPFQRPLLTSRILYSFSNTNPPDLQKLKQDSQAFYQHSVQRVHEMQSIQEWASLVESSDEPVVLDLYADWCEPCKKLTPILEKAANAQANWKLLKINIDKIPEVANQLQIKSVPTVILVANKQFIDAFSGYPDETTLKRFFGNIEKSTDLGFIQDKQKENAQLTKLELARNALMNADYSKAVELADQLLKDQVDISLQPILYLMLAHSQVELGNIQAYESTISTLKSKFQKEIDSQNENLKFLKDYLNDLDIIYQDKKEKPVQSDKIATLKNNLESDPQSLEAKYALAEEYLLTQMNEQGLGLLLEIVKTNKAWQNKKANTLMLETFKRLGTSSELTVKYRKLFQRLLN